MASKSSQEKILILFDLDDTLTPKGKLIEPAIIQALRRLKDTDKYILAVLTTTGEGNMIQQLGSGTTSDAANLFDYLLAENGLVAYKNTNGTIEKIAEQDINDKISKDQKAALFDFAHKEINNILESGLAKELQNRAKILSGGVPDISSFLSQSQDPKQVLEKVAMLNFTPIGTNKNRSGYPEYRKAFTSINSPQGEEKNQVLSSLRAGLVQYAQQAGLGKTLEFTIGGSTGVDASPPEWNKTYGYTFLKEKIQPSKIYFFGDNAIKRTGNDYKVCQVVMKDECQFCCFKVGSPKDTESYINLLIAGYNPVGVVHGRNNPADEDSIRQMLADLEALYPEQARGQKAHTGGRKRNSCRRKSRNRRRVRRCRKRRKTRRRPKKRHRRTCRRKR